MIPRPQEKTFDYIAHCVLIAVNRNMDNVVNISFNITSAVTYGKKLTTNLVISFYNVIRAYGWLTNVKILILC